VLTKSLGKVQVLVQPSSLLTEIDELLSRPFL
jgi:hypothetical protein